MDAKTKLGKHGVAESSSSALVIASSNLSHGCGYSKPSWLLLTIADLDERIKSLKVENPEEGNVDTFANRAEAYYQQRPQLLTLLHDLYNGYLALADRYSQALSKNHPRRRFPSPISPLYFDDSDQFDGESATEINVTDSDAESSLSYQPILAKFDGDLIIAELVIKTVDFEIMTNELTEVETRWNESSRKIELQKSLLEVLESERLILLSENASLSYRVNALMEENNGLVSETMFMKRRASELARCVLKMREDRRVCLLSRKIEDLQGQIYMLEKQNQECYAQLVKRQEADETKSKSKKVKSSGGISGRWGHVVDWKKNVANASPGVGKKASKIWDKVKNFEVFLCGPQYDSTYC